MEASARLPLRPPPPPLAAAAIGDDDLEIAVADAGIGISPAAQKLLFQSFVRLDSALRIGTPGTGLGLYLTRKLAEEVLLGGRCGPRAGWEWGAGSPCRCPECWPESGVEQPLEELV